ncbi:MAG: hypothetical protein M3R38_05965 [Actinomycetota bacterium]|nr:hypothetical protein [Actinomycetota bacterium]
MNEKEVLKAALQNALRHVGELYVYSMGLEEQVRDLKEALALEEEVAHLQEEISEAAHEDDEGETCPP